LTPASRCGQTLPHAVVDPSSLINLSHRPRILKYSFAGPNNEHAIKQLLTDCDLPNEDITGALCRHFLLVWDGPGLVGAVGLELKGRCALLRSLAVNTLYRKQKIATRLVSKIEDYAKSLSVDDLYLLTLTAEAFFKKHGYRMTTRESAPAGIQQTGEFNNLCPSSAVCMVKHLAPD